METRLVTEQDREDWIGVPCVYTDPKGEKHYSLITALHGMDNVGPTSVNVVFVSARADEQDQYGRQIARQTSLVARRFQTAGGMFFSLIESYGL